MDNNIARIYTKCLQSVTRFKQNVDAIFTARANGNETILPALLARNRGLLLDLRKAERELKISIEFKRCQTISEKELTEAMMDQLHSLEYEKNALENEIKEHRAQQDKELSELGFDITQDRDQLMKNVIEELEEREKLQEELRVVEQELKEKGLLLEKISESEEDLSDTNAVQEKAATESREGLESIVDDIINDQKLFENGDFSEDN